MTKYPSFKFNFLYPRYWIIWLGIISLYLLVLLPYPILYNIGYRLGRLAMICMQKRTIIARRNLSLCFPEMIQADREILLKHNFESLGMGFIETGMAWFWPEWRVKKWSRIIGIEHIKRVQEQKKGILLIGMHFLTLELGARIFGIYNPGVGVYRPNNNLLLNWLQTWGRLRSNKFMLNRNNIKGIIRALKSGHIVWYAPDQDYGLKNSIFVPLFAVNNVATTIGTYVLARRTNPAIISIVPRRLPKAHGYELLIFPDEISFPLNNAVAATKYINKIIEKAILLAPDQYMWLHRRFKTRPNKESSLYN